jgi:hypothetical protein
MREILERSRRALEHQYGADPRFLASLLAQLSQRYAELGDSKIRGMLLARAETLAVGSGDAGALTEIRCDMVDNLRTEGRYDDAQRVMRGAESMLGAHPDPRTEAACLQSFAELENETGLGHRAVSEMRRAIAIRDSLGETRDMAYMGMLSTFAHALERAGDYRGSLAEQRRAMAALDSSGRGETMTRAIVEHDYAVSLLGLGETAEAERALHDVLVNIARSDPAGTLPTQPLIHYAHAALFDGHADSAAKYFAMLASQAAREHNAYWEGRGSFGLAQAQLRLGRRRAAQRMAARVHEITSTLDLHSSDDQVTDARILDALFAMSAGDTATAHELVVQVLRANGYFEGTRRKIFHSTLILAAETALSLGDPAEALGYARAARVKAAVDSAAETRSAYVGEARLLEARALLALGDSAVARTTAVRAVDALRSGAGAGHPRVREAEALLASLRR